jgi:hypothetical protein
VHALLGAIDLKTRWLKKDAAAKLTRFLHTTLTLATTKNLTCVWAGSTTAKTPNNQKP